MFSFPYPVNGTVIRKPGEGCLSCVHKYCPGLYWYRRYTEREPDSHNGIQCASWSSDPSAKIETPPTQTDLDEEQYMYDQQIGSEANRGGITDLPTGTWRRP